MGSPAQGGTEMTPYEICVTFIILIPLAIWAYNDKEDWS